MGLLVRQETADAAPVKVTSSQLLINQRISQAGVRRSNEALALLAPIRPAAGKTVGWATANLLNGAVTNAKLGSNAVTGSKIADGSVGNADLAGNAVTGSKIADGAVGNGELATNSVTTSKIADGSVVETDLAASVQAKLGSLFAVVKGHPAHVDGAGPRERRRGRRPSEHGRLRGHLQPERDRLRLHGDAGRHRLRSDEPPAADLGLRRRREPERRPGADVQRRDSTPAPSTRTSTSSSPADPVPAGAGRGGRPAPAVG